MNRISLLIFFFSLNIYGQELSRRASWQTSFQPLANAPGMKVTSVERGSPLEKAGLKTGDVVLKVNDMLIQTDEHKTSATYSLRSEEETRLLIKRNTEVFHISARLNELGKEEHGNLHTHYETVTSDYGIRQRIIITRPIDQKGKLPAIFLLQGLSCSTIEKYSGRGGNWVNQINDVIEKSDMVVMRIDKPGVGDSDGDCAETDFLTELNGYKAALRFLKQKDYVDTSNIVIYGSSMGSALAPLLANEFNVAGVISDGTFFKTWFEHMLEIERRIRQMSGDDESTIVKKMNEAYIPLYYGMLIQKKTYEEVIEEYPAIAEYNYHGPRHMYGRPVEYYQQLQDFDLAGEWEKLKVPVRILYGTNDWIMSEFDNHMIMKVLEKAGHKDYELKIYPGLDHWNTIHESPENSFNGITGKWDPAVPELIIEWAREMVKKKNF
ncbi:MAG: alpha/beta fold hydrolase [Bacteroidota bacterium]